MSKSSIEQFSTDRIRMEIERRQQGMASPRFAADWTTDELIAVVLDRNAQDIERQYAECRAWRDLLVAAGYQVYFMYTGQPAPFDREWQVYQTIVDGVESQVATIDIDGCGASWHGDDELWLKVIGPSKGVTK